MRHGYYLKRRHCAYSGIKELTMEMPRSEENPKRKMNMKMEKKRAKSAEA